MVDKNSIFYPPEDDNLLNKLEFDMFDTYFYDKSYNCHVVISFF